VARRPRLLAPLRLLGEKFNTGFALAQPRLKFSLVRSANAPLAGSAPPAGFASLRLLARTPRTTNSLLDGSGGVDAYAGKPACLRPLACRLRLLAPFGRLLARGLQTAQAFPTPPSPAFSLSIQEKHN